MQLRSVELADLSNKKVVIRVDYNISYGKTLRIVDDTRIVHTLPTIKYLLSHNAKTITLISHLGKPAGAIVPGLSLSPVATHLSELLGEEVCFCATLSQCQSVSHRIRLLENLRFDPREESGDIGFAKELATLGDIYVNEAFSESHRNVSSMTVLPTLLPSYAGLGLIDEVHTILKNVESPARPFVVVIGGAKVKDKIGLLETLSKKADYLLIGGGMANTFLLANGINVGDSLVEPDKLDFAKLLLRSTDKKAKIVLPTDYVQDGTAIKDIGEGTRVEFGKIIEKAHTIIWNGPMGVFEDSRFAAGTESIYAALVKNEPAMVIVGGGDTLAAIKDHTHLERIDFVSTGGGAMLELIEKGTLPALMPLLL